MDSALPGRSLAGPSGESKPQTAARSRQIRNPRRFGTIGRQRFAKAASKAP
jgi:hypothetical protein